MTGLKEETSREEARQAAQAYVDGEGSGGKREDSRRLEEDPDYRARVQEQWRRWQEDAGYRQAVCDQFDAAKGIVTRTVDAHRLARGTFDRYC